MHWQARIFIALPPIVLAAFLFMLRPAHWDTMRVVGAVLTTVGIGLLTVARVQLGNSFSISPQARALVTTGLYRKIRNPVYVFGTMAVAGGVLYLGRPRLLVVLAVLIPLQVLRARAEAKTLEEKFGDDYRAWRHSTWF